MGDYRINVHELARLIDQTADLEKKIEDRATAIDKRIAAMHITWTGAGATGHKQAHDARIAAVAEMREALKELRDKLRTAHDAYDWVGPTNHKMWP